MANATGYDMVGTVLATTDPHTLFGASKELAKTLYQRLARNLHPDVSDDPRAEEAFAKLNALWEQMNAPAAAAKKTSVTSKLHVYELEDLLEQTPTANIYRTTWDAGHGEGLMKITRKPTDNDLASAEARALKKLREVPADFQMYHPNLIDAFRYRDASTRVDRATLVTDRLKGFYSVSEIKAAYPHGVHGRDVSWMLRRLFVAIGTAHDVGIIHGSVAPENVMIHPAMHGLVLTDWHCSVEIGTPLKAVYPDYRDWMQGDPKKPVDHSHDIRFAAKTMRKLVRTGDPQLRAFLNGCMVSSVPTAGELLHEFDELLERLYGKRVFHPFAMPTQPKDA